MKENLKLGGILLIITSIAGLLLGFANNLTAEAILENSKVSKDDLAYIMPTADGIEDTEFKVNESITEVYEAVKGSESKGYILKATTKGFHGPVEIIVGVTNEAEVSGIKIMSHSETPGLGARIEEEGFLAKFKGLPTTADLEVVKVTPTKETEVEGISGASVSSKAVVSAVNEAVRYFKSEIKGEEVAPPAQEDATSGASQ